MNYNILSAKIDFNSDSQIERIVVLVEISKNDIRAIESKLSDATVGCYKSIEITDQLSMKLLQDVAGYGREVHDVQQVFPDYEKHLK